MALDYLVVGNRIKSMRRQRNITQEELGKKLDLSVAYISRIERGRSQINLKRLVQLSEILGVSLNYLITGSMENTRNYLSDDFKKVLDSCTPEKQRCILEIAKLVEKL